MRITTRISLFLVLSLALSCDAPFDIDLPTPEKKTAVLAELEVGKPVSIRVTTTFGLNEEESFPTDTEGITTLENLDDADSQVSLNWISKVGQWVVPEFDFHQGQELLLETDFSDIGLGKTRATTIVPPKAGVSSTLPTEVMNVDGRNFWILNFKLQDLREGFHYHIIPFVTDAGLNYTLDIVNQPDNEIPAVFVLTHTDGTLIDNTLLDRDNNVSLLVRAPESTELNPSTIYLNVRTISNDHFLFHRMLTNQKETQQSPIDAPIPTFSNIEGGEGIFAAYQIALDSISVQ